MKWVMVTTKHRGVFAGQLEEGQEEGASSLRLKAARMAIRFGTTRGVMQLAETGPTGKSKISAPADVLLHDVTAVFDVTKKAAEAWKQAS